MRFTALLACLPACLPACRRLYHICLFFWQKSPSLTLGHPRQQHESAHCSHHLFHPSKASPPNANVAFAQIYALMLESIEAYRSIYTLLLLYVTLPAFLHLLFFLPFLPLLFLLSPPPSPPPSAAAAALSSTWSSSLSFTRIPMLRAVPMTLRATPSRGRCHRC